MILFLDHALEIKRREVKEEEDVREGVKSLLLAIEAVEAITLPKGVGRFRKAMEDFKQADFTNDQKVIKFSRLGNLIREEMVTIITKFVSKDLGLSALVEFKDLEGLLGEVKAIILTCSCNPLREGDVKDAIPVEVQADGSSPLKGPKTDDPEPLTYNLCKRKAVEAYLSSSEHPPKRSKTINESLASKKPMETKGKKPMETKGKKPMETDLSSSKPHPSLSKPPGSPEYLKYELMSVDFNWCAKCTFKPGEFCQGCGMESPPFNWGCRVGIKCHACGSNQHFAPWCDDEEKLRIYRIKTDGA